MKKKRKTVVYRLLKVNLMYMRARQVYSKKSRGTNWLIVKLIQKRYQMLKVCALNNSNFPNIVLIIHQEKFLFGITRHAFLLKIPVKQANIFPGTQLYPQLNSIHQYLKTIQRGKLCFLFTTKCFTFCVKTTGLHLFSDRSYSQFLVL